MHTHPPKSPKSVSKAISLPEGTKNAQTVQLPGISGGLSCSADVRASLHTHIAEHAYFTAEKRSFIGGDPIQDWLAAEQQVLCL